MSPYKMLTFRRDENMQPNIKTPYKNIYTYKVTVLIHLHEE